MVAGSLALTLMPARRRAVRRILGFAALQAAMLFVGALRPSTLVVAAGMFGVSFTLPIILGYSQSIWQRLVPAEVQGRVFSVRAFLAQVATPFAFVLAGPLADRVFEPAMQEGGALATTQVMRGLLYEVEPTDPLTFAAVSGVLFAVACGACALPAWRASRVPPAEALRGE